MEDLISIIIPCYNSEKTIERCIRSVLEQSYKIWELIIVDDGSTDSSSIIIRKFAKEDSRIKYFYQKNTGVSNARNKALYNVEGRYTAFLDSDDWYDKDFLYKLMNKIEGGKYDIACSAYKIANENGTREIVCDDNLILFGSDVLEAFLFNTSIQGFMCNKIFKTAVLNDILFDPSIRICEDLMFLCKLYASKNLSMNYINEPLYNYWITGTGACNNLAVMVDENGGSQLFNTCEKIKKELKNNSDKTLISRFAAERITPLFWNSIYNKEQIKKQAKEIFWDFLKSQSSIKSKIKFLLGYYKI